MDVQELRNSKVTVIGAARSGVGVATLLQHQGAKVFVSDKESKAKLESHIPHLKASGIEYELGRHSARVYDCSLMVVSPGVPSNAPVVLEAQKRGIEVVSELEAASWFCKAPMVAITGSNGKTTTTTLLGRILDDAKKKHVVAGNIGTAFSSVVLGLAETDIAVLEVSSFQLDHCESFRPKIAVILNITPDHMDRYENSMEKYSASKARIFMNQTQDGYLIYDVDDEWTVKTVQRAKSRTVAISTKKPLMEGAFVEEDCLVTMLGGKRSNLIPTGEIGIRGTHNLYNAMAATVAAQILNVAVPTLQATLRNFKGVEHRLEFVRKLKDVQYYNDSKATNVDSVSVALQAFKEPIVVLLGGRDKGNDYSKLNELVKTKVRSIIAIGESADKVEAAFSGLKPVTRATTMVDAVVTAQAVAQAGDVVVLSPACASFDWFDNYEHRGKVFKDLVNQLQ
jgi:UDP-N-acetylmuramoylalanine--D-glutamate ligase